MSGYIVCPQCGGKGTQTLHGAAYTREEMDELGPEFMDDYLSGVYDHPCDHCQGKRVTTQEEWDYEQERAREMVWGY